MNKTGNKISPDMKRSGLKSKRIYVFGGITIAIIAIILILSLPLWNMPVQVIETYTETELKNEPYDEVEQVATPTSGTSELKPTGENVDAYISQPWYITEHLSWHMHYDVPQHYSSKIEITYYAPFLIKLEVREPNYSGNLLVNDSTSQATHTVTFDATGINRFELILTVDEKGSFFVIKQSVRFSVKQIWTDQKIEERVITKYREVPVQIQKQRTVTQYQKVSIWEMLLK